MAMVLLQAQRYAREDESSPLQCGHVRLVALAVHEMFSIPHDHPHRHDGHRSFS